MKFKGISTDGHITHFDSHKEVGGDDSAATPMEVLLQSMAACTSMDVVSILRKKRRTVEAFDVLIDGERKDVHPRTFSKVHLKFILKSPDAELKDLNRAVELSQTTYCGAAAMFRAAGCEITYETEIINT